MGPETKPSIELLYAHLELLPGAKIDVGREAEHELAARGIGLGGHGLAVEGHDGRFAGGHVDGERELGQA